MRTIARRQPVSFTELGHFAQLDRSTVSRNVRVLDRLGLLEWTRSAEDHRETAASLSVPGAGRLDEAMPPGKACSQQLETSLVPDRPTAPATTLTERARGRDEGV